MAKVTFGCRVLLPGEAELDKVSLRLINCQK